jgi:flagellar motility protein MotE (MotC chaperone)
VLLAADAAGSAGPWWVIAGGLIVTVLVALIAARGPVWVEKAKHRLGKAKPAELTAAQQTASGEEILREWLKQTRRERDRALREVDRLEERIKQLELELHRLGWDGRTA